VSDLYFPRTVRLFFCIAFAESVNRSQIHECGNWERGRADSFLGIFVSNFRYGAIAVHDFNDKFAKITHLFAFTNNCYKTVIIPARKLATIIRQKRTLVNVEIFIYL
jgi:hypothetical protein